LPLPVLYYLPGYGNSAAKILSNSNIWLKFTQKVADEGTPVILVVCGRLDALGRRAVFEFTRAG